MFKINKTKYFARVEDKYVFSISTIFWHFLIGVISLSAIVGILVFVWSIIPSLKKSIEVQQYPVKPNYLPEVQVDLHDIEELKIIPKIVHEEPPIEEKIPYETEDIDPNKPHYDILMSKLEKLIPPNEWQPGIWEYPNGIKAWNLYKTEDYREWKPVGNNLEKKLNIALNSFNIKISSEKITLVEAFMKVLEKVDVGDRGYLINEILNFFNGYHRNKTVGLEFIDSSFSLISNNLKSLPASKEDLGRLLVIALKTPIKTYKLIPLITNTCNQFSDVEFKIKVYNLLVSQSYNFEDVDLQKEATQQFIKLIPQLTNSNIIQSFEKCFSVYIKKNQARIRENFKIDQNYENEIKIIRRDSIDKANVAVHEQTKKQETKKEYRMKSYFVIIGGFVAIALLGTILTLLSIQRILKRLELNNTLK